MLRPKLMTGKDLDDTVTATRHLLGCDERYGVMESMARRELEALLDQAVKEQATRREIIARQDVTASRD